MTTVIEIAESIYRKRSILLKMTTFNWNQAIMILIKNKAAKTLIMIVRSNENGHSKSGLLNY